jgi:hypothetical protein
MVPEFLLVIIRQRLNYHSLKGFGSSFTDPGHRGGWVIKEKDKFLDKEE